MEAVNTHFQYTSEASFFSKNPLFIEERIARRKPLLQKWEDGNIISGLGVSMASYFSNKEDIQAFDAFIANRKNYLKSLKYLGENWISGKSLPPNDLALNIGSEILDYLDQWYANGPAYSNEIIPAIIMGPIPSGGLTLEISKLQDERLYINIFNNGQIAMEFDNKGYFTEIETTEENYRSKLAEFLSKYEIWNNYSGRRNPL